MKVNIKNLLFNILLPIILAFTVYLIVGDNINYYNEIIMPIRIPKMGFMIIWIIIYIFMGTSAYLIEEDKGNLKIYYLQMVLNILWLLIFFNIRNNILSLFYTILLAFLVFVNMIKFYNKKKISGILFFPYFIWMLFGIYLLIGINILN